MLAPDDSVWLLGMPHKEGCERPGLHIRCPWGPSALRVMVTTRWRWLSGVPTVWLLFFLYNACVIWGEIPWDHVNILLLIELYPPRCSILDESSLSQLWPKQLQSGNLLIPSFLLDWQSAFYPRKSFPFSPVSMNS